MQTKGSSLQNQGLFSFRDHYHESAQILVARAKTSPSPHSASLDWHNPRQRGRIWEPWSAALSWEAGARGKTNNMWSSQDGLPQEEKSSPGPHSVMHIKAPKRGSSSIHKAHTEPKAPSNSDTVRTHIKIWVEKERAAPQEIQPAEETHTAGKHNVSAKQNKTSQLLFPSPWCCKEKCINNPSTCSFLTLPNFLFIIPVMSCLSCAKT